MLKDRGALAVSLLEATAVIAVGAILVAAATTAIANKVQDARIHAAHKDVSMIGGALGLFNKDLNFYPVFKSGTATSPADAVFFLLASENGDKPQDSTGGTWRLDEAAIRDTIENQLMHNNPGGSGVAYPQRGQLSAGKGWFGPYVNGLGTTDTWGNKYLVNVQFLTAKGLTELASVTGDVEDAKKNWAVFVLSAGPNETIQTPFRQLAKEAKASGDDIIFQLQ